MKLILNVYAFNDITKMHLKQTFVEWKRKINNPVSNLEILTKPPLATDRIYNKYEKNIYTKLIEELNNKIN